MKVKLWFFSLGLSLLGIALGVLGYFISIDYIQAVVGNIAISLLGLAIAILLVNSYLAASERGNAAQPLLKLIAPAVTELHNDLFVQHWSSTYGIEKARMLVDVYQKNNRNPHAYSPQQRDEIHAAVLAITPALLRVHEVLIDQFRELSMITGWSFDPSVTAAALEARLNFVKFKSLHTAVDDESKYQLIEAYLDGEAAASAVLSKLAKRMGLRDKEWKGDI